MADMASSFSLRRKTVKILIMALLWEFGMGLALFSYIWVEWMINKDKIAANGWNLRMCTPFEPKVVNLLFLVPVVRILWYLCVGDFLTQVSDIKKENRPEIRVKFLSYDVVYREAD